MLIRIVTERGDIRQGRYVMHSDAMLIIHDGVTRHIPLNEITDIREVPKYSTYGMCAADVYDEGTNLL